MKCLFNSLTIPFVFHSHIHFYSIYVSCEMNLPLSYQKYKYFFTLHISQSSTYCILQKNRYIKYFFTLQIFSPKPTVNLNFFLYKLAYFITRKTRLIPILKKKILTKLPKPNQPHLKSYSTQYRTVSSGLSPKTKQYTQVEKRKPQRPRDQHKQQLLTRIEHKLCALHEGAGR